MGKTFVRVKENYSLAEKKELGELVEKYKKEDNKEIKVICHFSMQKMSTRSSKRKGSLLTFFRPPGYSNPSPLIIFYTDFQPPCLLDPPPPPPFIRELRVMTKS